jgi:hypothetical protein
MPRPAPSEYAENYRSYLDLVPEEDIGAMLESSLADAVELFRGVSEAESRVRHQPYTWSVKQVVGHLIDSERIFAYRALRFARGDATPLPSFDENAYAESAGSDQVPWATLVAEFEAARRSHLALFGNLSPEAWQRTGIASDNMVSVLALAYIIVGHQRHHVSILRRRLGR